MTNHDTNHDTKLTVRKTHTGRWSVANADGGLIGQSFTRKRDAQALLDAMVNRDVGSKMRQVFDDQVRRALDDIELAVADMQADSPQLSDDDAYAGVTDSVLSAGDYSVAVAAEVRRRLFGFAAGDRWLDEHEPEPGGHVGRLDDGSTIIVCRCGAPAEFQAAFGAPGVGYSYRCAKGHPLAVVGAHVYRCDDEWRSTPPWVSEPSEVM